MRPVDNRPVPDVSGNGSNGSDVKPDLTPYLGGRYTDTGEYLRFVRRVIRGLSRRIGEADLAALGEMVELRAELDRAMIDAVAGLRNDPELPASWADIGRALGISRQAAQERYRHVSGLRRPGGQRGTWR